MFTQCPNCNGAGVVGTRFVNGCVDDIDCQRCHGTGDIHLRDFTIEERNALKRCGIWVDAQGNQTPFADMSDDRLRVIFRSIKRYHEKQQRRYRSGIETQWLLYGDDMQCGDPGAALRAIESGEYFEYDDDYPSSMEDDPAFSQLVREMRRRGIDWLSMRVKDGA